MAVGEILALPIVNLVRPDMMPPNKIFISLWELKPGEDWLSSGRRTGVHTYPNAHSTSLGGGPPYYSRESAQIYPDVHW